MTEFQMEHKEGIKGTILTYIKSSWDTTLSDETKSVFFALAVPNKLVPVNSLSFDTRINLNKIAVNLAALEALQLICISKSGVSKLCELTDLGWTFADKYNLRGNE